jgi:hypothetical protein
MPTFQNLISLPRKNTIKKGQFAISRRNRRHAQKAGSRHATRAAILKPLGEPRPEPAWRTRWRHAEARVFRAKDGYRHGFLISNRMDQCAGRGGEEERLGEKQDAGYGELLKRRAGKDSRSGIQ